GIYDREYYRREGPSYLDSLIPSGLACKWLIGINIAIFVLQLATKTTAEWDPAGVENTRGHQEAFEKLIMPSQGPVTSALKLDTEKVREGQVWRLLTHAFLHSPDTLWHILFNLLF